MGMIRLFTGYDERESVGWHVFCQSVLDKTTSVPVQITPITKNMVGGTNSFTRSRFLIPYMCDYKGWAIFADGADMICRSDLSELWAYKDDLSQDIRKDLWCVKHSYQTRHLKKYEGTEMMAENTHYDRKNWASLFLINCESPWSRMWHPELVATAKIIDLLQLANFHDDRIGALPPEWNWLVGEYPYNENAKIAHFTLGIPGFSHYATADYAREWHAAHNRVNRKAAEI